MKEKNKYLKIVGLIAIIVAILVGGFFLYKTLNKDTKKPTYDKKTITPLLYEVSKDGSNNKMYLFGSIHMANMNDLVFPEYVLKAYNDSHYVACEYNIVKENTDMEKAQAMIMQMLYQDGTTIKDHISEDTYNKLVDFLTKKESYSNVFDYYKPVFFYSLITNYIGNDAKLDAGSGIDEYFIKKAASDKKTILEVETMESQTELLLSFSDSLYEIAIKDMLDNYDDGVKEIIDLYDSWKKGDEKKLLELNDEDIEINEDYTEKQKKEIAEFNKKIVTDRNKTMTDKAIEYFSNNQDVFFMVGTLHIIGDDGIVNNLIEKGYTVKRIQ